MMSLFASERSLENCNRAKGVWHSSAKSYKTSLKADREVEGGGRGSFFVLTGSRSGPLGLTWTHLVSLGLTWSLLD